ncbi:MAG: dUTP diphosphatase [Candidatus Hodarchaeales archaeon]|jgi:dUTP pyrophosphatase
MMKIKVKKLSNTAIIPKKHDINDAAFDLFSNESFILKKGETKLIKTGICLEIPPGYFGKIESRSSLAKQGIFSTAGVIDAGYREEVMVVTNNFGATDFEVIIGNRIAQIIIHRVETIGLIEADELDPFTDRGGGFGSSGE